MSLCQHQKLTWDLLYCKGFCTDCGARIVVRELSEEAQPEMTFHEWYAKEGGEIYRNGMGYEVAHAAWNAAKALPPEAIAHVWQPIETAPRDEETILLRVPTLYGKWNKTLPLAGRWEQRDPPSSGFWIIFNADEAVQRVEPTHWMPLPSSPMNGTSDG